jgi:hypothetical protein
VASTCDYTTTSVTWKYWITNDSSTTAVTSCTGDVWTPWCASDSNTTAITTNASTGVIWYSWNGVIQSVGHQTPPRVETAEAIREREERHRREDALRAKAERQAEMLLRELLTPEQRHAYERDKKFHVITASGRRYEVDCQRRMHNIFDVDDQGRRVQEHCIYQQGNLPLADNTAAQLLLLRANEDEFRRIANQRRVG